KRRSTTRSPAATRSCASSRKIRSSFVAPHPHPLAGERGAHRARDGRVRMERRVVFSGWLFPVLLLLPQLAVTVVFFFWPAAQAILQSVRREDAFGLSTRFVAAENFTAVLGDPFYLASAEITVLFSIAVAGLALASGLLF